ncbi:MAG: hypothetical protein IJX46_06610 [Clostridia bacterium]|nr:hypothetical protein [Clostridia bacterium]
MSVDNYVAVPREDWEGILNSVRGKTGKTARLKSGEVKPEIDGIETGVDLPEEAFVITGDCRYKFAFVGWNWFIDKYGSKITTKDIANASYMFINNSTIVSIPFDININSIYTSNLNNMFSGCYALETIPKINGISLANTAFSRMFSGCQRLRELPEDIGSWFDWERAPSTFFMGSSIFSECFSLRKIPNGFLGNDKGYATSVSTSYVYWYSCFYGCYVLDELYLPIPELLRNSPISGNSFYNSFGYCYRLKSLIFATQEDGTPYTVRWKAQTIDLSAYVGYASSQTFITNYNSGITADKCITANNINDPDAVNDPDAFALQVEYSRYNHDSAVATINSLPDTSAYLATAGGTNTIKFKGASGSGTAGGAINTLTAEEIAVATAKGWTVTLV